MREKLSSGAEVRFVDHDQVLCDLRQAALEAKAQHPEIVKVFLFGTMNEE